MQDPKPPAPRGPDDDELDRLIVLAHRIATRLTGDHHVAALSALPKRQRETVVLRFLGDLSEADVARTLGCSVGTVKSSTSRGIGALRAALTIEQPQGDRS